MKRFTFVFMCIAMVISVMLITGCGSHKDTAASNNVYAKITDDMGRTVSLQKKPERIVVLSASFLEPLHAVGGDVVGRPDSKTNMPDWAKDKQSVGAVYHIDIEKVLACNPDLVIINKGMNEKLIKTFDDNHIPSIVIDMKSYDDVKREINIFAQITGEMDKGNQIISDMDAKIQAVKDKIPHDMRRVTILHSTAQGMSVQLDGSIAGSIAKMLGWENTASGMTPMEKHPDAAPYSMETVVEQNPEIIFVTSMGKPDKIKADMDKNIAENPAWQTIPAIKEGHLFYLPQNLFLLSPGIHYPEAVETMAKLVYPDRFSK